MEHSEVFMALRVFLRVYDIAMVTLYAITITITGSRTGKLRVIVASRDKEL